MQVFALIMYVLALLCFLAAAFGVPARVVLGWLGLAFALLPTLVATADAVL